MGRVVVHLVTYVDTGLQNEIDSQQYSWYGALLFIVETTLVFGYSIGDHAAQVFALLPTQSLEELTDARWTRNWTSYLVAGH